MSFSRTVYEEDGWMVLSSVREGVCSLLVLTSLLASLLPLYASPDPNQIAQELMHNPFMRVNEETVREATRAGSGVEAMKRLREMKNSFRPPPENPGRFPAL